MESLTFTPGQAFLSSDSPAGLWSVVFEDEGATGYCYACDLSLRLANGPGVDENSILDAMLVYNVGSLSDPERERLATIEWSRDGMQAVLYLDGTAQALVDFAARESCCRSNFPNFVDGSNDGWRKSSHAWSDAAMERFESALYA
jgi:hypothetical protein